VASLSVAGEAPPPKLDLVLKPHTAEGKVDYVEGELTIEQPKLEANGTLLRMPLVIVSIPTARYDGDALHASDASGELKLAQKEEAPTPTGTYRQWLASRATNGDVVVRFKAPPRVVDTHTRTGPLFDLRSDGDGVLGAGITFLPLPAGDTPRRLHIHWDLSNLPQGSRGTSSFGEGEVNTVGPADRLAFCFYAAGSLYSDPTTSSGNFAMYWFTPPPFDTAALATHIQKLRAFMANFFHDEEKPYRVFIRHNPHKSGGGTALPFSFMFGWNEAAEPTLGNIRSLLSHEMTHNWPAMEGEHGDTSWYSEGTAEFYSLVLSYRAGAITLDEFLREINERAEGYYTNPYRAETNEGAAKQYWKDWAAQRVPYGRGFMYLAQTDAEIRAKSRGKHHVDEIVIDIFGREQQKQPYGIAQWQDLTTKALGPKAKQDFDAMVAGKLIVPPPNSFGPCLKPIKSTARPFALGFDEASINAEPKVIHGVVAGSAAAAAGLKDGDKVVSAGDVLEIQRGNERHMTLTVQRDGREIPIDYLPRGEPVENWQWQRVPGVKESKCGI
jgi:hypothetical protein